MTPPPPGWYTDSHNPAQVRFWNGERWTELTRPVQYAMAPPAGPPAYANPPGHANPPAYAVAAPPSAPAGYGYPVATAAAPSAWQRNRASMIAAALCVVYLGLAFSTHFVVLGIAPLLLTVRAFRRQEPFAVGALALAIITLGVSVTAFTH